MPLNKTNPSFPSPYVNDTKADDPMMKRVPMHHTDIGARVSGMPKDVRNDNSIDHVENRGGSK